MLADTAGGPGEEQWTKRSRMPPRSNSDKTHSAAGALHALAQLQERYGRAGEIAARPLMYVIAGHHAGLANWTPGDGHAGLSTRLLGEQADASRREHAEALQQAQTSAPRLLALPGKFDLRAAFAAIPGVAQGSNPLAMSLWIRLLFSALVNAEPLPRHFAHQSPARKLAGVD